MNLVPMLSIAFSLFLLMDPIGNMPLYITTLQEIHPKRQQWIIFRELIIALAIIIIFNFIGDGLLNFLNVTQDTIQISGGIILFLISLKMIFPAEKTPKPDQLKGLPEPFIVPLAVPLMAGPTVLAAVVIYSHQYSSVLMVGAICIAWATSLIILLLSPFMSHLLGMRGIIACERLMGLILTMIGIQMFLSGVYHFVTAHQF